MPDRSSGEPQPSDLMPAEGDMVIVVREHGRGLASWVRRGDKFYEMPAKWEARYDASPKGGTGELIAVTATVGWTLKEWKEGGWRERNRDEEKQP